MQVKATIGAQQATTVRCSQAIGRLGVQFPSPALIWNFAPLPGDAVPADR